MKKNFVFVMFVIILLAVTAQPVLADNPPFALDTCIIMKNGVVYGQFQSAMRGVRYSDSNNFTIVFSPWIASNRLISHSLCSLCEPDLHKGKISPFFRISFNHVQALPFSNRPKSPKINPNRRFRTWWFFWYH